MPPLGWMYWFHQRVFIHTFYDQSEPAPTTTRVTFSNFVMLAKVAIISKSDLAKFGHMY